MTEINDKRGYQEFAGITFSTFQKSKAKQELLSCLSAGKLEAVSYWTAEFVCAGHFGEIWEIILLYMAKHVHLGSPKLPIYIASRFESFKVILSNGYVDNELALRNNPKIRHIFAEIVAILCLSRKKHVFEPVKINREEEFDMTNMASKLKAPDVTFVKNTFQQNDPKEFFIAMNEFAFHISKRSQNAVLACYWLEWLLEFESMCKRNKEACACIRRSFVPVAEKWQMLPIWMIWDALLHEVKGRGHPLLSKIAHSLLANFCIRFSAGVPKRRKFLLYFAVSLLCESVDYTVDIVHHNKEVEHAVAKMDVVYKEVKKNEQSPATQYLFHGVETERRSNLERTIERLEKMDKINQQIPTKI